jgi:cyanophycinase-like exopeptidase
MRADLPERPAAAYLGASNGDDPAFYSIFEAAMDGAGIADRRRIVADFPPGDREFLERADLVLLAGGDPLRGWRAFAARGIDEAVARRFDAGALLIGVSAGAVQLGWGAREETAVDGAAPGGGASAGVVVATFRLVPYFVGAHEEAEDWRGLERTVVASGAGVPGLGVPAGGAVVVHPDGALEPVGRPAVEIRPAGDGARARRLLHRALPAVAPDAARAVDAPGPGATATI